MKKIAALVYLLLAVSAFAAPPYPTVWYREKVQQHEQMLNGAREIPGALSVAGISYSDTVWDDLTVSALNLFDPPGNAGVAIVAVTTGLYAAEFSVGESGAGVAQMKHSYKRGTAIHPHLHATGTAGATNVWNLTMNCAPVGGAFTNAYVHSATSVATAGGHWMVNFPHFSNGLSESAIIGFVVSNAGPGTAYLLDVDFHFEIEKPGSDEANPDE